MDVFVVNCAEVLTTGRELDTLSVLLVVVVELLEIWVQYMVKSDLVCQSYGHVIATWMEST